MAFSAWISKDVIDSPRAQAELCHGDEATMDDPYYSNIKRKSGVGGGAAAKSPLGQCP